VVRGGAWPIKGIEPCRDTVRIRGSRFHVHGRLEGWMPGWYWALTRRSASTSAPSAKLAVRAEWAVKRTLFQAFSDKPVIWLDNYARPAPGGLVLAGCRGRPGFEYKVKVNWPRRRCSTPSSPRPVSSRTWAST
jgi:hypothetical protein